MFEIIGYGILFFIGWHIAPFVIVGGITIFLAIIAGIAKLFGR